MESARTDIGAPLRGSRLCQNCGRSNGNRAYACKSCHRQIPRKGQSIKEKGDGNALTCPTSLTKTLFPQLKEPFPFAYENVVHTTVPLFVSSPMILWNAMQRIVPLCKIPGRGQVSTVGMLRAFASMSSAYNSSRCLQVPLPLSKKHSFLTLTCSPTFPYQLI